MSDNGLSQTEADKLFNQMSKAVSTSDNEKLNSLFNTEEEQVQEEPEKTDPAEQETSSDTDESTQDNTEEEQDLTTDTPEESAVKDEKEEDQEPEALKQLREQLAKVQKENQSLKSQAGRVPFVQRQVSELTKKLEELSKHSSTPSNLPSAKLAPKLQEKLKAISETDPELAKVIAESIAAATDEVASDNMLRHQETLSLLRDTHLEEQKQAELSALLDEYPNAPEVFASADWKSWKQSQSEAVRSLASSGFARDVSLAFEMYAKDMMARHPELAVKVESPAVAAKNEQAAKVAEVREQRKASSTNVRTPSAPAKVNLPDDPELLFKQMYAQINKERTGK
ncbi:hypothetical protein [Xanthomonas phage DES1]|nr:hypothetical protein [Xanthomonas phage DES1]